MYDYYLGGKDNYLVDREAVAEVEKWFPTVRLCARINRDFMQRSTMYLARECGIDQYLDIGTGIPTAPNLHQIAQEVTPAARVVYADSDPLVLAHARALLTSTPDGRTAYLSADARDPRAILDSPKLREVLDLSRPVALSMIAVLHFVDDDAAPYDVVSTLTEALAPGSYLTITHLTPDFDPDGIERAVGVYRANGLSCRARGRAEFARFFDGVDLVDPGIGVPHRWRAGIEPPPSMDKRVSFYSAVARVR
jgi:hypothetical protein